MSGTADVRVVAAGRAHYADFARLFAELRVEDPVPPPARWLESMAPGTLFLEAAAGGVVAYGYAQALSRTGYVRHMVVDPAHRRRGLGRRLMHELAAWLRARDCERWELNVLLGNAPAIALYRSLGLQSVFRTWVVRLPPAQVKALAAADAPVCAAPLDPVHDAALEARFAVAPGLLAQSRAAFHRTVLVARRGDEPFGLACFDGAYPGCWPFCATSAAVARRLLEALLPQLPEGTPWLQLVVERDAALAGALCAAGASLRHEIVHMEGALPPAFRAE